MNCPRVNLLKKSERRYQGAVSRRFILISAVVTPILFIALVSGVKLVQFGGLQRDLKGSRQIWEDLRPQIEHYTEQRRDLTAKMQSLELVNAWKASQVPMVEMLSSIQSAVPDNIQFTRLSIRSELKVSSYKEAKALGLPFNLVIQGLSQGDDAESGVIGFRKELLKQDILATTFSTINLDSLRRRSGTSGELTREFNLIGTPAQGGGE